MALQNSEKQKRYRENKLSAGERRLTCWLDQSDNERLLKLMAALGYGDKGKLQDDYTEVIRLALVQLDKKLNPPRNGLVRLMPQESI